MQISAPSGMTLDYLYVAIGSAIGGVARLALGSGVQARVGGRFPIGTLVVNAVGSFVIGALLVILARKPDQTRLVQYFLMVGFCGGFTTFSTFSADTVTLAQAGSHGLAAMNVAASVGVALLATLAGMAVART